ncbi:hypothetical protein DERF_000073 [Dermatophagoides farinae]|uniref:Uncharacterized protein n=1 Tax=Dermatophagoides farinae TaxID=6954 RepID=A0A922I9D3_DERFA|nr:hypothetical protein DERF_000073 [Dermatophagoides farinae]
MAKPSNFSNNMLKTNLPFNSKIELLTKFRTGGVSLKTRFKTNAKLSKLMLSMIARHSKIDGSTVERGENFPYINFDTTHLLSKMVAGS